MVSGILVELHSQHLCVGLISLDKLKTRPVDRYRSDATLVFPSDPEFCNIFRPPSAAAYLQTGTCTSAYSQRSAGEKLVSDGGRTVRVVQLRVQRQVVSVTACRRYSVWGGCSSTCVLQSPGRRGRWRWGWGYGVDHGWLQLLLFEVRRPWGASLWRCGMLTLQQHNLDSRLRWSRRSAATHGLFVRG